MSPLRIVAPLFLAISLSACSDSTSVVVQRIQEQAVKICSYLPSAQSTLEIVKAASSVDVNAIAKAICDAVTQWQQARGMNAPKTVAPFASDCPRVNGICVEGTFVDKDEKKEDSPKGE